MIDPDTPYACSKAVSEVLETAQCVACFYVFDPGKPVGPPWPGPCPKCHNDRALTVWPFPGFSEQALNQLQQWNQERSKNASVIILFSAAFVEAVLRSVVVDSLRRRGLDEKAAVRLADDANGLHRLQGLLAKMIDAKSLNAALEGTEHKKTLALLDALRESRNKLAHGRRAKVTETDARDAFACVLNFNGMMRELLNHVPRQAAAGAKERGHGG